MGSLSRFSVLYLVLLVAAGCQKKLLGQVDVIDMPVTPRSTDRKLSFVGSGGLTLHGVLTVPAGYVDTDHPGVLILGDGPSTDKDGNHKEAKCDTLKQLAQGLAAAGIVTFRFDNRATRAYADKWPSDITAQRVFFSFNSQAEDAVAAWRAFLGTKLVTSRKCAILGHGEGGLIATAITHRVQPQAMCLLGFSARPLLDTVRDRLVRIRSRAGLSVDRSLAEFEKMAQMVKSSGQINQEFEIGAGGTVEPRFGLYYKQASSMNTYGLLRQVIVPVLVINGDSDQSINPKVDPARVFAAVKGNPASKLVTVPLCSHDFKAVQDEADPGFLGEVVPDVTEALNEFLVPLIGGRIPDGQTQFHD